MDPILVGALVKVETGGPVLDGIVFDAPSPAKLVVALMDPDRGPVLRTLDRTALTEREEAGPDDQALRMLIRRTPVPSASAARGVSGPGRGRPGHARSAMHRTTGK